MYLLSISYGWYLTMVIGLVGILLLILGWIFYRFYRFLLISPFLGYNIPVRLINIALASLLFSTAIRTLIIKPIQLLFSFIELLFNNINLVSIKDFVISSEQFITLVKNIYYNINVFLNTDFIQIKVFIALAFMGGFTLFVNKVFYNENSKQYQLPTIKGSRPLQQNLFLFLLMAFSLFLVLSAMIAIPVIDNPKNFNTTKSAYYDSMLNNIKDAKANAAAQYTISKPDSTNLYETVSKLFDSATLKKWKRPATYNVIRYEKGFVQSYFQNRVWFISSLIDRHNKAIGDFEQLKNSTFDNIQFKLRERSSRLSFGKEEDYYLYLVSSYSGSLKRAIESFQSHQVQLKNMCDELKGRVKDISSKFPRYISDLMPIDTTVENNSGLIYPNDYFNLNAGMVPYDDISSFAVNNAFFAIQDADQKRTLFESIGDWLANTNSMDIVLIVGMFGFGLLGATISSFITTSKKELHDPTTPLVDNLSVVTIRGFSAAIVIFLATKGSIAVINNGGNDPNPYVLFFACIVGAVYSERIWGWAKKRLESTYTEEEEPEDPNEPQDPVEPKEPEDPVAPNVPVAPKDPADPADPNVPVAPNEPADQAVPIVPEVPNEPAVVNDPADPEEPQDPVIPAT